MKIFISIIGVIFGLGVLNSCGTSSTACNLTDIFCSCDLLDDSTSPRCIDYEREEPATAQGYCSDNGGTFSNTLCSTEYRLGTCKRTLFNYTEWGRYYLVDFGDSVTAAAACGVLRLQYIATPGIDYEWVSN